MLTVACELYRNETIGCSLSQDQSILVGSLHSTVHPNQTRIIKTLTILLVSLTHSNKHISILIHKHTHQLTHKQTSDLTCSFLASSFHCFSSINEPIILSFPISHFISLSHVTFLASYSVGELNRSDCST